MTNNPLPNNLALTFSLPETITSITRIPLPIIGGYLGTGKPTLLNPILRAKGILHLRENLDQRHIFQLIGKRKVNYNIINPLPDFVSLTLHLPTI